MNGFFDKNLVGGERKRRREEKIRSFVSLPMHAVPDSKQLIPMDTRNPRGIRVSMWSTCSFEIIVAF